MKRGVSSRTIDARFKTDAFTRGKSRLKLDDETYRDLLRAEAGVASSNDLDNRGLSRVLKRLGKMGFTNTAHRPLRPQPKGLVTPEQATIAEQYGVLMELTGGYDTFAKQTGFNRRCCGKAIPQTRGDAIKVIEGQKTIPARQPSARPEVERSCENGSRGRERRPCSKQDSWGNQGCRSSRCVRSACTGPWLPWMDDIFGGLWPGFARN